MMPVVCVDSVEMTHLYMKLVKLMNLNSTGKLVVSEHFITKPLAVVVDDVGNTVHTVLQEDFEKMLLTK